ncbi:MAG: hypothetical protein ACJ78X_08645, partial [Myxococcales bacterium]
LKCRAFMDPADSGSSRLDLAPRAPVARKRAPDVRNADLVQRIPLEKSAICLFELHPPAADSIEGLA